MIGYMHHAKQLGLMRKRRVSSLLLTMKLYHTHMSTTSTEKRIGNAQYVGQMMVIVDIIIV